MEKVVGTFLIATLLFASPAFATPIPQVKIASANQSQASKTIRNNIFNLSDQQMRNAIKIGNGGLQSLGKFQKSQNFTILYDKLKMWQPTVHLNTPYYYIAVESCLVFRNYEQYSLADAKKTKETLTSTNELSFNVKAYGDEIDFAKTINVVLKQGSKIFQPLSITGRNDFANRSESWPNSPSYEINLMPSFDMNKIDFSKPAELIYLYSGKELSVTYKVDFSKIK